MPIDNVELNATIIALAEVLQGHAVEACGFVRCRISSTESWIAHIERFDVLGKKACTEPQFIKNWGEPIGPGHLCILPGIHEVYGLSLPTYLLQAYKGLCEGIVKEPFWTFASEDLKPTMCKVAQVMDEQELDRIYLGHFDKQEKLGRGYGFCSRKMLGEPCQFAPGFRGSTIYQAGLISLAEQEPLVCCSDWVSKHLKALDDAIHSAGLEPEAGYNGGNHPAKSSLRTGLQGTFKGVSSIEHS